MLYAVNHEGTKAKPTIVLKKLLAPRLTDNEGSSDAVGNNPKSTPPRGNDRRSREATTASLYWQNPNHSCFKKSSLSSNWVVPCLV